MRRCVCADVCVVALIMKIGEGLSKKKEKWKDNINKKPAVRIRIPFAVIAVCITKFLAILVTSGSGTTLRT
jgi:uncharacterized membrane protein